MAFAILGCAAVGAWLFLRSGGGFHNSAGGEEQSKNSVLPRLQGNEEKLVQEYIVRNADDSSSVEIAEWGEPRFVLIGGNRKGPLIPTGEKEERVADEIRGYTPGVIMHLRWREKNRFGAKVLREGVFLIQEDRVVRAEAVGEGEFRGYPYATALSLARTLLGPVAAERVGGKLTEVIVRGNVSCPGPILQGLWVSFDREGEIAPDGSLASEFEAIARKEWREKHGRGGRFDHRAIHAVTSPPRYEISGVSPGTYLVTVEGGKGMKTTRSITVTDTREIQTFDFDLKAESTPGKPR